MPPTNKRSEAEGIAGQTMHGRMPYLTVIKMGTWKILHTVTSFSGEHGDITGDNSPPAADYHRPFFLQGFTYTTSIPRLKAYIFLKKQSTISSLIKILSKIINM
jgi:hypothetical protein